MPTTAVAIHQVEAQALINELLPVSIITDSDRALIAKLAMSAEQGKMMTPALASALIPRLLPIATVEQAEANERRMELERVSSSGNR